MINAEHYCKFVKVNGPLSPVLELQVSPRIVSAARSWKLRVTPPHVYHRDDEIHEGGCWDAGQLSSFIQGLTPLPQRSSCGFLKKMRKTASVTHAWQSVITGAQYCVFTLKVVQVSICLGAWQRCTHMQHIQAASLVNVSSALGCLTEKEHFSPSSSVGSHLFLMLYQHFFPLPIVLKSPFIFKHAPSKVLLSGDC